MIDDARRAPILLFDGGHVRCPVKATKGRGANVETLAVGGMMREGSVRRRTTTRS